MRMAAAILAIMLATAATLNAAEAFAIIELTPATFPPNDAGIFAAIETAQEQYVCIYAVLFQKRDPPKIPIPDFAIAIQVDPPQGGAVMMYPLIAVELDRENAAGQRIDWSGKGSNVVIRGAGKTALWMRFRTADLKRLTAIGVESFVVMMGAASQAQTRTKKREVRIRDLLHAPAMTPPPLISPRLPAPPMAPRGKQPI